GYTFAMDKYRANDIVYEVNLRATDVWHKYQEQPLPDPSEDGTDFDEFPDTTGTGYPIYMTSHPDVAFKTYVEGVSSRVCKNVVNMNLNGIVKGIQFVQVNGTKYTGNASICGEDETDNTIVFTSFVDSDTEKSDDNQNQHCVEEEDCVGLCSPYTCDNNMTCRDKCYGLDDTPYCYDDGAGGQCVACTQNEHCADYGDNYVCNTAEHTCQPVRQCVAGEYRAKNGACIPCTDINAIEISLEKYSNLSLSIEDDTTGQEQCNACNNTHTVTIDEANNTAYCAVACIRGVTYESLNEGCIPCRKADGTPNDTAHKIPRTGKARKLCEACGLVWWSSGYLQNSCDYMPETCPEGTFAVFAGTDNPRCEPCSNKSQITVYDWAMGHAGSSLWTEEKIKLTCISCPERTKDGVWGKRELVTSATNAGFCRPLCEQPDEDESITACTDADDSTPCERQYRSGGKCYACSDTSNRAIETGGTEEIDTYEEKMCVACDRTAKNGYCMVEKPLKLGQFRGKDGEPYDCTINGKDIVSEEDSGCIKNCRKKDGQYSTDADAVPIRWIYTDSNGNQKCLKICPENQWQNSGGACLNCNKEIGWTSYMVLPALDADHCDKPCASAGIYKRTIISGFCVWEVCPNDPNDSDMIRYRSVYGECYRCDATGEGFVRFDSTSDTECARCSNRVSNGAGWNVPCVLIDPSVSGVCNSDNWTLPTKLASDHPDLYDEVQEYVRGDHDGEYFRDNSGKCHECTTEKAISTSQKQCNLCNVHVLQRTYSGGVCSLGGCQTNEFMNNTPDCVKCTPATEPSSYINTTYQLKMGHTATCGQCGNRQVLTVGSNGLQYCVPNTCGSDSWQSARNGKCLVCSEDNNVREIGTEAIYRQQCEACNRVAFSQDVSGKTVWYCSKQAEEGYFIDSSGNIKNCSTAGDTQIADTAKAKSICRASGCNRVAQSDSNGNWWCVED
ncbi:MAG: hypothetical protein IJY58_06220, partial [Alphaproteobacteria bacterium]|nr:hypothetical protein [Alphaproteobacteria bacterium]